MEYKKMENCFALRFDKGEEIVSVLLEFADKQNIGFARVSAIGAVGELEAGILITSEKKYRSKRYVGDHEIVSLCGTLTRKDLKPYAHLHVAVADVNGCVFGGHLNSAVVSATCEMTVEVSVGEVGRFFNDQVGLNLFKLK